MKSPQKAFLITLLVLLVIASGIAFFKNKETETLSVIQPSPTDIPREIDSVGTGTTTKEGFFTIPEAGLQMKIDSNIRDLTYFVEDFGNGTKSMGFVTKSLQEATDTVTSNCSIGGFDVSAYHWTQDPYSPKYTLKVGQIYSYYHSPQEACNYDGSNPTKSINPLQIKQTNSLLKAWGTLEPIQ